MAGKSALTDEQWVAIYNRVENGENPSDIDRELGFAGGNVRKVLTRRFGLPARARRASISREDSDAIYARLVAGESVSAVAREFGFPHTTNMYRMLENRYGYKASDVRRRLVWAPTVRLDNATVADLAYFAGIIDGEGSIIRVHRNRAHPVWVMKCNMTDRPVIEWLHTFGGTFGIRPSRDPGRLKEQYAWNLSRQLDVQTMLTALLPYLKVKRDKAAQALAEFAADPILMEGSRRDSKPASRPGRSLVGFDDWPAACRPAATPPAAQDCGTPQ